MEASSVPAIFYRSRPSVPGTRLRLCSDDQLVERYRAGRDEAFRVIHDRYHVRLLAYVRQMLAGRSSEDVEDAVQDVFERAARTLRAETAPVGLRPWLYGVAHNRCIDELRRRPPAASDVFATSRPPAVDTSTVAERRADMERLFRDLRALPELQRSALLMRELQGLSHAELALVLDASVPAVKSLLVRARVGLLDAEEAREAPCARIREDLAATHDRRVKASAQASRHLRECSACRGYRNELRRTSRRLAALIPGPTLLPLGLLGRLLGGSGLHSDGPAVATGIAGSGGAAMAGAGKMVALLGAGAALTTGAMFEQRESPPARPAAPAGHGAVARVGTSPSAGSGALLVTSGRGVGPAAVQPGRKPSSSGPVGAAAAPVPTAPGVAPVAGPAPPAATPVADGTPAGLAPGRTDAGSGNGAPPVGTGDAGVPSGAAGAVSGAVTGTTSATGAGSGMDGGSPAASSPGTGGDGAVSTSTATGAVAAASGSLPALPTGGGVAGSGVPGPDPPASGLTSVVTKVGDAAGSAVPQDPSVPGPVAAVPAKLLGQLP